MKVSKDALAEGKKLFKLCQADGKLNEEKLRHVIRVLIDKKPRGYRDILVTLKRLLKFDIAQKHIIIETAQELDQTSRDGIQTKMSNEHGEDLTFEFKVTPELLGGMKISKGDDVWDGSVKSRIDRLEAQF